MIGAFVSIRLAVSSVVGELTGTSEAVRAASGTDPATGESLGGAARLGVAGLVAVGALFPVENIGAGLARGVARTIKHAQCATVDFSRIGNFVHAMGEVPGQKGAGHVRWNRILDREGHTIRLYKDVYEQGGNFLRRDWYVGGPK